MTGQGTELLQDSNVPKQCSPPEGGNVGRPLNPWTIQMKRMTQSKAGINLMSVVLDSILEKVAVGEGVNMDYR